MNHWPAIQPKNHKGCQHHLVAAMAEQGVQVEVSAVPQDPRGPFQPEGYECPHGTTYWIMPTEAQLLEWAIRGIE